MQAVICDLDGLLVDSEPLHFEAYKRVLKDFGIDLDLPTFIKGWLSAGNKHYGTQYYLEKVGASPEEIHKAREKKAQIFQEIAKGKLKTLPGVESFLQKVQDMKIPCGLGTGGYRSEYMFSVEECNLSQYFQALVGGDEADQNKPHPDIFFKTAEKLGADPEKSVVLENSDVGLHAAINGNIPCIIIPSEFTKEQDFSGANQVLSSLEEVNLEELSKSL